MNTFAIVHIIFNTVFGVWLAYISLLNPITRYLIHRWRLPFEKMCILFLVGIGFSHLVLYVFLGFVSSEGLVALISAALFLLWALASYYILQRHTLLWERTSFVQHYPNFLPIAVFLSMISCGIAIFAYFAG